MVCPILCYECSEDLAEIYPFFEKVKQSYCEYLMNQQKIQIHVDKIDLRSDVINNLNFIFEALKINNDCCRIHILGNTDFDSIYY